ncbi:MAG: HEPN domain-containing protein [Desulfitobacteriaceae bacterium]
MGDSTDYRRWMSRARQDLRTAYNNLKDDPAFLSEAICYACQQGAEKLLKAFLLDKGETLLRTHDLVYLLDRCAKHEQELESIREYILDLNEYTVEARYPGDFIDVVSVEEAEKAYEAALIVERIITGKLK